jgi:hypothetical protein
MILHITEIKKKIKEQQRLGSAVLNKQQLQQQQQQ